MQYLPAAAAASMSLTVTAEVVAAATSHGVTDERAEWHGFDLSSPQMTRNRFVKRYRPILFCQTNIEPPQLSNSSRDTDCSTSSKIDKNRSRRSVPMDHAGRSRIFAGYGPNREKRCKASKTERSAKYASRPFLPF